MKNIVVISLLVIGVLSLSACETVKGVGRDIHKAGQTLEEAINGQ